jgi:hypothetical protein
VPPVLDQVGISTGKDAQLGLHLAAARYEISVRLSKSQGEAGFLGQQVGPVPGQLAQLGDGGGSGLV